MEESTAQQEQIQDVRELGDDRFSADVQRLIDKAEDIRVRRSQQLDSRKRVVLTFDLLCAFTGGGMLGWLILMGSYVMIAAITIAASVVLPIVLHMWGGAPEKEYIRQFKDEFMPELAKALGGLKFKASGGISPKSVVPSRIMPAFDEYHAEDCFYGTFKGIKVLISEARMYSKKRKGEPVFDGVFVLLQTPAKKFRSHTIITADKRSAKSWMKTRWKQLQRVQDEDAGSFLVFSNNPGEAQRLCDSDMMELMNRLSEIFGNSELSVAFYGGNKVFLLIPYEGDMFEPGNIHMPVTTGQLALRCKKEVEQILSVVEILDVYEPEAENTDSSPEPVSAPEAESVPETASPDITPDTKPEA